MKKKKQMKKRKKDLGVTEEMAPKERSEEEVIEIENGSDIQSLIEKNIKWSQIIYAQNKKIKSRLTMLVIGNYLRLLLIFIPLIIGIIYLFPFVNSQMERVDPLLQLFGGTPNSGSVVDTILDRLSPQDAQKIIQSSGESNQ